MSDFDNLLEDMSKIQIKTPTEEKLLECHNHFIKWLKENPNNFSFWFKHITIVQNHGISIPKSTIINVPEDLLDSFFLEKNGDREKITDWVLNNVLPVIKNEKFPLFMKNGCFSNKYDFSINCLVPEFSLQQIAQRIINIQQESLCWDTGGNLELIFREYIQPERDTETIYNGMPLRPEIRVFYNFDSHKYVYDVNYWDYTYCHGNLRCDEDELVFTKYYPIMKDRLETRKAIYLPTIQEALSHVTGLSGNWSVDFMLDKDKIWLIDMAEAHRSAYYDPDKFKFKEDEINKS